MATDRQPRFAFNRGIMSALASARQDLNRYPLSAEVMTNWVPRVMGSMMLRPGWRHLGASRGNALSRSLPFVFATNDLARIELTDAMMRVWVNDALISRGAVSSTITNGTFDVNVAGWTDDDESGATSAWATGGYLSLVGTGPNAAIRTQQVTVAPADQNAEHAIRIVIARGTVSLRVGSTSGDDDYINETTLGVGTHSLALTPTGDFFVQLLNRAIPAALVDSVAIEGAGVMEVSAPWASADLRKIRMDQSGDVIYVACAGYQQHKIERRGARSWSVVKYAPTNGPFRVINTSAITIAASATSGDITLTASKALFRSGHAGALFRLTSVGQQASTSISAQNQFTSPIRVTGVDDGRAFSVSIAGTFVGTVTLQYSVGSPGSWVDAKTWTGPVSESYNDGFNNQIIYYRLGIKTGGYTSGTAAVATYFTAGSLDGIVRITEVTNSTTATAQVLTELGGTAATTDWYEGRWSTFRGWPSAVALHEGRLGWAGKGWVDLSESDGYESFDDTVEGDSGPISRTIGDGPVDVINWMISLGRLHLGSAANSFAIAAAKADGNSVHMARSSSLDEPLSPTNFNFRRTLGRAVYVDRSGQRLYELSYDPQIIDYNTTDLSLTAPDLNEAGLVHIAVQMKPDVRVHCVREDGTVGMLIFDRAENVVCWVELETDGFVEDACVLPGTEEDAVYYTVRRTVNSSTVRYHERWALESECSGLPEARHADSFVYYSGAETQTISNLSHLEGREVVVWGWNTVTPFMAEGIEVGRDLGTYTVNAGQISGLSATVTNAVVGLAYEARYKSLRITTQGATSVPMNSKGRVEMVGFILRNTHYQGITFGEDFDNLDALPLIVDGKVMDDNAILETFEGPMESNPGDYGQDPRVCLLAAAPRPATVLAITIQKATTK